MAAKQTLSLTPKTPNEFARLRAGGIPVQDRSAKQGGIPHTLEKDIQNF